MTTAAPTAVATQTYRVWIKSTPEAIWQALTDPAWIPRYGYCVPTDVELRPGGRFRVRGTEEMVAHGAPALMIEGEVLEVDAPHRFVQTWHPRFDERMTAEPASKLTYEIEPAVNGVTKLTVVHELDGAPAAAAIVSGTIPDAGGGWGWILSDLKTLLETGAPLPSQMGG